ncbi:MAG: hypothetical protein HYV09_11685 [Deltaproteobacteria bacterium]|nr:hypothetical protein [Deltaproteobacteria bacterium]
MIQTRALSEDVQRTLLALAGRDTRLHRTHRLYIDVVPAGLPFLPQRPVWHLLEEEVPYQNFEVEVLDVIDVVVSKLKRFNANDRSDIDEMIARGHVAHEQFVARFRSAVDAHFGDESLPSYCAHFHTIERDAFGCDETEIELPDWMT